MSRLTLAIADDTDEGDRGVGAFRLPISAPVRSHMKINDACAVIPFAVMNFHDRFDGGRCLVANEQVYLRVVDRSDHPPSR